MWSWIGYVGADGGLDAGGADMFGKPDWFRAKTWGWGLTPITWQGWAYTAAWTAVTCLPFVAFTSFNRWPEAIIWIVASVAALFWDVKNILAAKHPEPAKDVLYIGDEEGDSIQTSKLDLRLRKK